MRFWLDGMDEVRKFHCFLDEEDRNIVPDEIPIPFLSVELDCKSAHIANSILRCH